MKTLEEIKNYFSMSVAPGLDQLDQERRKILLRAIGLTVVCWSVSIAFILSSIYFFVNDSEGLGVLFAVVFSLPIILWGLLYGRIKKSWRLDYKKMAVMPLIEYMDPYFKYEPELSISQQEFFESELYRSQADDYTGDDLISGKIAGMDFRASELEITEIIRTKDGNRTNVIFNGLFFVAETESPLKSKTFLLNDYAERMLGTKLGGFLQSKNKNRGNVVRFDDNYFEKYYVVYSDDENVARKVFSQELIAKLNQLLKKKKRINISLKQNKIYIAISRMTNYCEPKLTKSLGNFSVLRPYFEDLISILEVAEIVRKNVI